jgi:hypothetical protein
LGRRYPGHQGLDDSAVIGALIGQQRCELAQILLKNIDPAFGECGAPLRASRPFMRGGQFSTEDIQRRPQ